MKCEALARRYRYLWTGEAAAVLTFLGLFLYHFPAGRHWSYWLVRAYGLAILIWILLQGISWWRLKLHVLRAGQRGVPVVTLIWFRRFKWTNWLLIGLFPLVLWLKQWVAGTPGSSTDTWVGLLLTGGALLEQINYYYYQLIYDSRYDWAYLRTHRRLRRGNIGAALAQFPTRSPRSRK